MDITEITSTLERMIELLRHSDQTDWAAFLATFHPDVARGVIPTPMRQMFGGMGSLNDVILYRDGRIALDENDEFDSLRCKLFALLHWNVPDGPAAKPRTRVSPMKMLRSDGLITDVLVEPSTEPPWRVTFSGAGLDQMPFPGQDLFEALAELRLRLEAMGHRLLCAGSRPDVYPSGMARSMGPARRAYVIETGKPATVLIDIFEDALPEQVATVAEQRDAFEAWGQSLRARLR